MSILISSEVLENRELSISESEHYALASTALVPCGICDGNYLEIFAKDFEFTKFTCVDCWEQN